MFIPNLKYLVFVLFFLPTENVALAMEHAAEGAKSWQMIEQEEYDFNQLIGRASYYSRRQTDAVRPCFVCYNVFFACAKRFDFKFSVCTLLHL